MTRSFILIFALFFPFQAFAADVTLRVSGSSTVLPLIVDAAKAFKAIRPDIDITVAGGGSGTGINSALNGIVDIGMTSRRPTDSENKKLSAEYEVIDIATDAVAVTVSKAVFESGVSQLSIDQVADIYRGKIKNWQDVGGEDKKILVIDKELSRGTRHVFADVILGNAKARAPGASIVSGSNNEERSIISRSDQAIGMLSFAWLNEQARGIGLALADGETVYPNATNIMKDRYPIQRKLSIIVKKQRIKALTLFIDFLTSVDFHSIIEKNGYLPVK